MQKENQYSRIGHKLVKAVKEFDYEKATDLMSIFKILKNIKIKEGYILDFFKTCEWNYDTVPYIRMQTEVRKATNIGMFFTEIEPAEKRIFQYLEIPFTKMGIWQGYLMHILPNITPKGGHANYGAVEEVYGYHDVLNCLFDIFDIFENVNESEMRQDICDFIDNYRFPNLSLDETSDDNNEKQQESLLKLLDIDTFLPKVTINTKDTATIESLFFSKFGGLIYEATTAIRNKNTLDFKHKEQRILIEYNCKICY